jgi:hypothetical protein
MTGILVLNKETNQIPKAERIGKTIGNKLANFLKDNGINEPATKNMIKAHISPIMIDAIKSLFSIILNLKLLLNFTIEPIRLQV